MKAKVDILGVTMEAEYEFDITSRGCGPSGPTRYSSGGEDGEPAEFDITILGLKFPKQDADVYLDIPEWLKDMLDTHLAERDDINEIVQQAAMEDVSEDYEP